MSLLGGRRVNLTPQLHSSLSIFLILTSGFLLVSCDDNHEKTVDPVDTTAPRIISVDPPQGSVGVSRFSELSVTFSENLAEATVVPENIFLEGVDGVCSIDGQIAVFTPTLPLVTNSNYYVKVTNNVTDIAGNPLAHEWESIFTTEVVDLPVAEAGESQLAEFGATVQLDGTASIPAFGGPLSWQWTQIAGPDVGPLTGEMPSFTVPQNVACLVFTLVVAEDGLYSEPDEVMVMTVTDPTDVCFVQSGGDDPSAEGDEAANGLVADFNVLAE